MPVEFDPDPKIQQYAHPERLVTTEWLEAHLGEPGLVVAESDEDVLLYDTGHIPGAVKIDWHIDLNDPLTRDYVDAERFAVTTDVPSPARGNYPVTDRDDSVIRAYREQVLAHIGNGKLVDVRSPGEFSGELLHMPEYPQEGALRGGHIPTAANVPWRRAADEGDGTFLPADQLRAIYQDEVGLDPSDDVIAYCRIGERSSHTWFVLTHLLGFGNVRNYDGSWVEWGNAVRVPIEK